jgi:hypothetical protein
VRLWRLLSITGIGRSLVRHLERCSKLLHLILEAVDLFEVAWLAQCRAKGLEALGIVCYMLHTHTHVSDNHQSPLYRYLYTITILRVDFHGQLEAAVEELRNLLDLSLLHAARRQSWRTEAQPARN